MQFASGPTTDNTETSNDIYFAGETVTIVYYVKDGDKSSSPAINLTGFTVDAKVQQMDTAGEDLAGAVPAANSVLHDVDATITDAANGEITVIIPKTILKTVGYSLPPTKGNLAAIGYAISYTGATGHTDIAESDVIAYRYNLLFDINAT